LVASGLLSHNLLVPMLRIEDDARKLRLARAGVLGFGLLASALALRSDGVLALVEQASAFGSAGILVTSLFALFTTWGDARTAIATLFAGISVYIAALALGIATPFLLSLAASLLIWTLGCALAPKAR
jgi:Na+/proline symporter